MGNMFSYIYSTSATHTRCNRSAKATVRYQISGCSLMLRYEEEAADLLSVLARIMNAINAHVYSTGAHLPGSRRYSSGTTTLAIILET